MTNSSRTADTERYFSLVQAGDGIFLALTNEGRALARRQQTPRSADADIDDAELVRTLLGDAFYLLAYRSQR